MKAAIFVLIAVMLAWSADPKYVQAKKADVSVYKNETIEVYEQPVFKVGLDDRLLVLDTKGDKYNVRNADGLTGWVAKKEVILIGKSKTFIFDKAEVVGYLDNPTPVYILDSDDPNAERIYLERSFKDELKSNIDKETAERQAK